MSQVNEAIKAITNASRMIREHMELLSGLRYQVIGTDLVIDTSYFDNAHDDFDRFAPLAEKLAYEVRDYDCPVSKQNMLRFCQFMGFNDQETETLLAVCPSDESYRQYLDEEMRRQSY